MSFDPTSSHSRSISTDFVADNSAARSTSAERAAADGARRQIHLPALQPPDCIVHYRTADFHVHSFVLKAQSTYFRSVLDDVHGDPAQMDGVVDEGAERRKVTASTLPEPCIHCGPLYLTRCVSLAHDVGKEDANEADLLLFLLHLCFSSTLHLPPWLPKAAIVSALTDDTPLCTEFPFSGERLSELPQYVRSVESEGL